MIRTIFAGASALALAACAAGPNYVAPKAPVSASGAFTTQLAPTVATADPVQGDWWRLYRDPVLDQLVQDALAANTDVRVAAARVARARALLRESGAPRLPSLDVAGSAQYQRFPSQQRLPGMDSENWVVDAGLNVSYEVDAFGRISRGMEAARGDLDAATADADATRVMVVAETVRAYADATSATARRDVAQRIVDLLDQSLSLTRKRVDAGLAAPLDVARISALRNQRAGDVPSLEAARQAALFRLATLTGRTPSELPAQAGARATMLQLDQPIPVGDGAALLARRPDVRAAERRLASATARIGVATADLYPRITLGGSIGSTSLGFGDAFTGGPFRWLLGPLLNWSINQTAARARIAGAEADSQAALATFDGTVLGALQETETALSNYARALDRRQALAQAREDAARATRITRAQQREGTIDALGSLDAERTLADAEAALALADASIAERQVDLFRALGGGWQSSPLATGAPRPEASAQTPS
ncbi:MAG TPA: TolC family protein [Croceibacterium sp.]|nr:TolC family protein [Croceibacterium sp.]